jgi:hypothetical protein
MRIGKLLVVAIALLAAPQIAFATHIPGSGEKVEYDAPLAPGVAATGAIGFEAPIDGYDWYCMDVTSGKAVTLAITRVTGDLKLNLGVFQGLSDDGTQTGLVLVSDTSNSVDPGVSLTFTPTFSGPVTVWVSTFLGEKQGTYSLVMTGGTARTACSTKAPAATGNRIGVTVPIDEMFMGNDESITVPFSVSTTADFQRQVNFSLVGLPDDVVITFAPPALPSPGSGSATLTIKTGARSLPATYPVTVVATNASDETEFGASTFLLTIVCNPPQILGIDQPRDTTFIAGSPAAVSVKTVGSGPLVYQWYTGPRQSTNFPVQTGGGAATLSTSTEGMYWVRVSNACGSVDSNAVIVTKR